MFSRFGKKQDQKRNDQPTDPAQLQKAYWTFNSAEKAALLARYPHALAWDETLRLHHLNCLELLGQQDGKPQITHTEPDFKRAATPLSPAQTLCKELTERLASSASPYRARHCSVWQGKLQEQRDPDLDGVFRNASLTHLGCIEIIRLNSQQQPQALAFVALDDILTIIFAGPALYRAARLFYDDGRPDEIVLVPLLYGPSWFTDNEYDHDGSMTRFCQHIQTEQESLSIGLGHQDFQIVDGSRGQSVFGLGSIAQIITGLEMVNPKFDQKCRVRGIDPDEARRQAANRKSSQ